MVTSYSQANKTLDSEASELQDREGFVIVSFKVTKLRINWNIVIDTKDS